MKLSVCKSDYFIERAKQICLSPTEYFAQPNSPPFDGNYYSAGFLDAYIMSATALEAFINERLTLDLEFHKGRLALPKYKDQFPGDTKEKEALNMLIKQNLETKYRLTPIILWNHSYNTNKYPFLDFTHLIKIRNDIIHYKMPFYDEQNATPTWANFLKRKGIFLTKPVIHPPDPLPNENRRIWIEEICTYKGAKWAYNTSCSMIKEYVNLAEGIMKDLCYPWVDTITELE